MEQTMAELCRELHNWFSPACNAHAGTYEISDGSLLDVDFLQDGQYFRIVGSVFNDGVYIYPEYGLKDETFDGSIWPMSVPAEVRCLAAEIDEYRHPRDDDKTPKFNSESFGGYSYTRATNSDGLPLTWRDVFRKRLNPWRKLP